MTVSFYGTFCSKDLCWFFAKECNFAQEVDPLFLGWKNVVPSGQTGFESPKKLIWDKDFQTSNKKFWWHSDFLTYFGSDHQNESEINESCMLLLTHFCHCWSSFYKKVSDRQFPKSSDLISVSLSIDCNTTLL